MNPASKPIPQDDALLDRWLEGERLDTCAVFCRHELLRLISMVRAEERESQIVQGET